MTNLNHLIDPNSGWVLTNATGINAHNEIVGSGLYNGQTRAFMLRQEGRITHIDPVFQVTGSWVYTNELDEVITQTVQHVETQVIQWSGIWGTNSNTPTSSRLNTAMPCPPATGLPSRRLPNGPSPRTTGPIPTSGRFHGAFFRVRAE